MKVYYHATLLHLLKDYYYRIAMSYLLAKLSQCILNSTNGLVVNEVYVLVLLLQILQKSIVTLAIIYKFGGYKEKGSRYLKNGTLRRKKYEITTTFDNKCPN